MEQYRKARAAQQTCFERHLAAGVIFLSPDGILIDDSVVIAPGATILPGTILRGKTVIGAGSVIGPNSLLQDACVGENVSFNASQGYACTIQSGAAIGPFSHIRPDSVIGENVHLGDFVEIKNSTIGAGTSVSHLTYVGDSDVGAGCNFGCGVAVANYDGAGKNRCVIGDYAFIGCNTNLVAPVHIGAGAYTAAGSTIVSDVPASALGIARARQSNKEGWAEQKLAPYLKKQKEKLGRG
ncbi:MAG: UDP-N-acetylglucosamine diphosphorylase [Ruthenibacterium sp.]